MVQQRPEPGAGLLERLGGAVVDADATVTMHGPSGQNVSSDLPLTNWPPWRNWRSRAETSLATV